MPWRRALVIAVMMMTAVACEAGSRRAPPPKPTVRVSVVDERGDPVLSALMKVVGTEAPVAIPGTLDLTVDQPLAGIIEADGYLAEPFVVDPADAAVTVKLFSRVGPSGVERLSFQFGGDVMMGRRYQQPLTRGDTPIATTKAGASSVVRHIAPIMAAADATTVNLETVVGQLPAGDAYPAKRFLLQSPPVIVAALQDLGVDLVTLGNNHAYDWQQAGIASTIASLDAAGIAWAGAGTTVQQARAGRLIDVKGRKVGVVSATTVNGDFVNDSLPTADEVMAPSVPAKDSWQYEQRLFGFGKVGSPDYMAPEMRRPGVAWVAFAEIEPSLTDQQSGALWAALVEVYPELQDWVARRGHGGAAPFQTSAVARSIDEVRAAGADLVIVEIHGGFQFSDVPSEFAVRAAHAAIDAGADLVVGHHPHVLQGFEWYHDHLIAYSLGNFVFDQDFLSTFPTVILRTIFEGDRLIDARVIPLVIDRYQPSPVGGAAATRVIRLMDSRSALTALSDRIEPRIIAAIVDTSLASTATVTDTGMTGEIGKQRIAETVGYRLDAAGRVALAPCTLVRAGSFDGEVGLELMQWGDIDDVTADNDRAGAAQWALSENVTTGADGQNLFLRLQPGTLDGATARPVARSATPLHRWYNTELEPVDGEPTYTIHMRSRGKGVTKATLRIAVYDVDDTDPTTEPVSTMLHETSIALPLGDSGDWQDVDVDLTTVINDKIGQVRPNAVLLYIEVPRKSSRLDIDDVRLMEWRDPSNVPDGVWMPADALRAEPNTDIAVVQSGCAAPAG